MPVQWDSVDVTAHVTDNVGVLSVTLTYAGTTVPMTLVSGSAQDGSWFETIGGYPASTTLEITITATDIDGNSSTYTHTKHWADTEDPVIRHVAQIPPEPEAEQHVTCIVWVTDNVGATSVRLTYDGCLVQAQLKDVAKKVETGFPIRFFFHIPGDVLFPAPVTAGQSLAIGIAKPRDKPAEDTSY